MPAFRPPMYGARKGRKIPAAKQAPPATPAPVVETAEETRARAEKERKKAEKKAAKAATPAPKAKAPAKKKAAAKKKSTKKKSTKKAAKAPKLKKFRASDTKDDLYWLAQSLGIEKIKTRTPKDEMIKILRRHPGTEEIKD